MREGSPCELGAPQCHGALRPVLDLDLGGGAGAGLRRREEHHRLVQVDARSTRLERLQGT